MRLSCSVMNSAATGAALPVLRSGLRRFALGTDTVMRRLFAGWHATICIAVFAASCQVQARLASSVQASRCRQPNALMCHSDGCSTRWLL